MIKRNSLMWLNLGLNNPPSNLILGNPQKIGLGEPLTEFRVGVRFRIGVRFRLAVKAGVGVRVGVRLVLVLVLGLGLGLVQNEASYWLV